MSVLKTYRVFLDDFHKKTDSLIFDSLKEEIEIVRTISDISLDIQDHGYDVQIWMYLKSTKIHGRSRYILFDKNMNPKIEPNADTFISSIDEYEKLKIVIDPLGSMRLSGKEYLEIRTIILKKVKSHYPHCEILSLEENYGPSIYDRLESDHKFEYVPNISFIFNRKDINV